MSDAPIQPALPGIPEPLVSDAGGFSGGGHGADQATFQPTARWVMEGLRAGFFLSPRVAEHAPTPLQVLVIVIVFIATETALSRLEIAGPARFDVQAWLSNWWTMALYIGLAWWAFPKQTELRKDVPGMHAGSRLSGIPAFFLLSLAASLPNTLLYQGLIGAIAQGWITKTVISSPWSYWFFYAVFTAWSLGVALVLMVRFVGFTWRAAVFVLAMVAATGLTTWQFDARAWQPDPARNASAEAAKPRLRLTQQTLEAQQALWQRTIAAIAPERPGVTDVYGLVFAPYASEDVFMRESTMVSRLFAERFDANGRVLHLLNHASSATTHPWATTLNLQRSIEALGERMDKQNDVLVVYLTSHGARDFKLAASHGPLEVEPLSPSELRAALDRAGIRNRVIAVSACYSGGWADALASETTLVMTAADATHTSYGCGRMSELTFFGRAMFDEQLRKTHSFEQAFASAVPLIKQREIDAGKQDGFSNPQIRVGAGIVPVLKALEQRLAALPPVAAGASPDGGKSRP